MTRLILVATALLLFSNNAPAAVSEADITAAYRVGDIEQLDVLRTRLTADTSADALLIAYLDWRLGSLLLGLERINEADEALSRAQAGLESLTRQEPESAEAWALLASAMGMRIGIRPMTRGIRMGGAADAATEKSLALEPENPRVLLIAGIGRLNTPALFGGSTKKAFDYFDRALASWKANEDGSSRWGAADIYVWRGIAHGRKKNEEAARADFNQAISIAPDYQWAHHLLSDLNESTR